MLKLISWLLRKIATKSKYLKKLDLNKNEKNDLLEWADYIDSIAKK